MGIELGTTKVGYNPQNQRWSLLQFKLVEIRSIQPQIFYNSIPSWALSLKYQTDPVANNSNEIALNARYVFSGGIGATIGQRNNDLLLTAMLYPELSLRPAQKKSIEGALFFGPDLLFYWRQYVSFSGFYHWGVKSDGRDVESNPRYGAAMKLYDGEKFEGEFRALHSFGINSFEVGAGIYF